MIVLGISDNHDSGACLIKDGQIISAVNEERLTREKLEGGFPYLSIEKVIEDSKISLQDIDFVIAASLMTPMFFLRMISSFHNNLRKKSSSFSYLLNLYIIYQVLVYKMGIPLLAEKYLSKKVIERNVRKLGIKVKVILVEHHHAHAASVYYTSGHAKKSLIITSDAIGDALSLTVNIGEGNNIKRIFSQTGFSSISTYYSRVTEFCGFKPLRHEGKITGLAGYGRFDKEIMRLAKRMLHFVEGKGRFNSINYFLKRASKRGIYKKLKKYSRKDIAYNFQRNFEEEIVKFVTFWVEKTNIKRIYFAGGVFANVSVNKRISEIDKVKKVYIFPYMGDGGLALGAVLDFLEPAPFYLDNIYLGSSYSKDYISRILRQTGLEYILLEEGKLRERIARLLYEGKTVAHFNGRMEYGPRALGNRSILYRADDPSCKSWLNKKLKRSQFMPFAPVTLDKEMGRLYKDIEKIRYTLRFMNVAVDCTEEMKNKCSGAVHIDGTARPQVLYREDNPRLYAILEIYSALKGISTVINTSFNRHEEPIVCSPSDAIRSFIECNLDYLVLNNFIVWQNKSG